MKLLSLLYVRLRQNIRDPGIGNVALETLLDCPTEHLEFHVWYFREKGWAQRTEKGTLAITVDGDSLNWAHRSFKSPPPIGSNVGVRRACLILFSEARPNSLKSRTNHFTLLLKQQREV
jgi:hypothetical protein